MDLCVVVQGLFLPCLSFDVTCVQDGTHQP